MSYTVQFYLIDLKELKETIGGGDTTLLDQLDFDEEDEEGRQRALELINGEDLLEDQGSEYGYALHKIVDVLGEWASADDFEDLRYGEFEGELEWILDSGPPVDLPENDDYPFIGYRTLEEIRESLFIRRIADDEEEEDDLDEDEEDYNGNEYYQDMLEAMYRLFREAALKGKDIITFYF